MDIQSEEREQVNLFNQEKVAPLFNTQNSFYFTGVTNLFNPKEKVVKEYPLMDSDKIDQYMTFIVDYAIRIALGVFLILISAIPILLSTLVTDTMLGTSIVLSIVLFIVAIAIFIKEGLAFSDFTQIHRSDYDLHEHDIHHLINQRALFKRPFALAMSVGVLLILACSLYPIISLLVINTESLFWIIPMVLQFSIAIFLFISFGIMHSSYAWFLRNDFQKNIARKFEGVKDKFGL